jgi:hypothetical protein
MIKQYESKYEYFSESFLKKDILKAIFLTNRVVGKRVGSKIYSSQIPVDFVNASGKYSGIYGFLSGKRAIRYNWKINDSSTEIVSIDFWIKGKPVTFAPDLTIDTEGVNIVKLVNLIASILKKDIQSSEFQVIEESKGFIIKEDFTPKAGGQKSAGITKALKQWAIDKDVTNDKLENTRIKYLWKDYSYWFNEIADETIPEISEASFRNYILDFMNSQGIQNIYVRSLKIRKGNKEKIIITDDSSEVAYQDVSHLAMNVDDMKEFMADSLRAVARGFRNSLIITGKAGFGKSSLTEKILKEEGMTVTSVQQLRNIKVLYNLFAQHGSPKDVILLDDTPDTFDKKFSGYLSAALDDKPKRIISFPSEMGKDLQDLKKFQPELEYKGKMIILTNKSKKEIPTYLKSRSITIEVQADVNLMADDIRKNLINVLPNVPMEYKLEVLEFIEKLGKHISSIDYRTFMLAVVFKSAGSPDWKKRVYALLK